MLSPDSSPFPGGSDREAARDSAIWADIRRHRAYGGAMAIRLTRGARYARRRRRRMRRVEHDLSAAQWLALKEAWGGCAYCAAAGVPLQRDCVLPIANGGRYTLANIVPACASCNASKWNQEVTAWLRRRRLDERTFLLRHLEIGRAMAERFAEVAEEPVED